MGLISIAGQLRQGKDAFADYLIEILNNKRKIKFGQEQYWKKVAFADGLKKVMMDAFGVNLEFIEKWKTLDQAPDGYDMTVRQALQFIGDGFRKIKSSVWVDLALRDDSPKVISDVRYLNEAKAVKERGGISILLWRPGFENDMDHPSENQLKPYIDWCSACGNSLSGGYEGRIVDWELYFENNIGFLDQEKVTELFDIFIINDGDLPSLWRKIDNIVLPYLENKNV